LRQSAIPFECEGMKYFEVKNLLKTNGNNNLSFQFNLYATEIELFSVTYTFSNSHAKQWTGCIPYTVCDMKSIPAWSQSDSISRLTVCSCGTSREIKKPGWLTKPFLLFHVFLVLLVHWHYCYYFNPHSVNSQFDTIILCPIVLGFKNILVITIDNFYIKIY